MLFLAEYGHPFILDSVNGPVVPKFSWFYSAEENDFMLKPIRLLEETIGATVVVRINGYEFDVPASWNLLVVDDDTKLVDTVPITQCSSSGYLAFMMHPETHDYYMSPIQLLDLKPSESCVHVMIPRQHMMLAPVGQVPISPYTVRQPRHDLSYCCLLTPQDLGK